MLILRCKSVFGGRAVRQITAMIMLVGMVLVSGCSNMNYSKPPGQTSGSIQGDFYGPGANRALQTVVWAENYQNFYRGYPHMLRDRDYIPESAWGRGGPQVYFEEESEPQEIIIRIEDNSSRSGQAEPADQTVQVDGVSSRSATTVVPASNPGLERRVGVLEGQARQNADDIVRVEQGYKDADAERDQWTAEMFEAHYAEIDRQVNGSK
jgi:hypothetical protein